MRAAHERMQTSQAMGLVGPLENSHKRLWECVYGGVECKREALRRVRRKTDMRAGYYGRLRRVRRVGASCGICGGLPRITGCKSKQSICIDEQWYPTLPMRILVSPCGTSDELRELLVFCCPDQIAAMIAAAKTSGASRKHNNRSCL